MVTLYGFPFSYLFQSTEALPALLSPKTIIRNDKKSIETVGYFCIAYVSKHFLAAKTPIKWTTLLNCPIYIYTNYLFTTLYRWLPA